MSQLKKIILALNIVDIDYRTSRHIELVCSSPDIKFHRIGKFRMAFAFLIDTPYNARSMKKITSYQTTQRVASHLVREFIVDRWFCHHLSSKASPRASHARSLIRTHKNERFAGAYPAKLSENSNIPVGGPLSTL